MLKGKIFFALLISLCLIFTTAATAKAPGQLFDNGEIKIQKRPYTVLTNSPNRDVDDLWTYRYMVSSDGGETWSELMNVGDTGMYDPDDEESTQDGASYDFGTLVDSENNLHFVVALTAFSEYNNHDRVNGIYDVKADMEGNAEFTMIAAMAEDQSFAFTDCGIDSDGNLYAMWYNSYVPEEGEAHGEIWVAKSTDMGASWSEPMMLTDEAHESESYPHISYNVGEYLFIIYQKPGELGYDQYILKMASSLEGDPEIIDLELYSGTDVSYYIGMSTPIDQDVEAGYTYFCIRNDSLNGVTVGNSSDNGENWSIEEITGSQRYPSVSLDKTDAAPWVFSNFGVPGEPGQHNSWYSFDEAGYNGGSWLDPTVLDGVEYPGELLYCNYGVFTTEGRIVAGSNVWSYPDPVLTPSGFQIKYSDDYGDNWSETMRLWHYLDEGEQLVGGFIPQNAIMAGPNNTVWVAFAAKYGFTDVTPPNIGPPTVSSYDLEEPWVVSANIMDDYSPIIYADINYITTDEGAEWEYTMYDSSDVDDMGYGAYYFTVPNDTINGRPIIEGDSIWCYIFAMDEFQNMASQYEFLIIAGQGVSVREIEPAPVSFELGQNYPNPFNNATVIPFSINRPSFVTLKVFDLQGRLVSTLIDGKVTSGHHSISWTGNDAGSGVYYYVLESNKQRQFGKMTFIR